MARRVGPHLVELCRVFYRIGGRPARTQQAPVTCERVNYVLRFDPSLSREDCDKLAVDLLRALRRYSPGRRRDKRDPPAP